MKIQTKGFESIKRVLKLLKTQFLDIKGYDTISEHKEVV